jgi:hypothetical protein
MVQFIGSIIFEISEMRSDSWKGLDMNKIIETIFKDSSKEEQRED